MPPKKKGIAKPKKASRALPTRRATRKKATAASDDNTNDASSTPGPIRVNTDSSNRQRTRARVAAARGTEEISPVIPVELGADPDTFAKEVAKGQTSMYPDSKGQGEAEQAEQQDTKGEADTAKAQQNSVEDVQQSKTRQPSVSATSEVATREAVSPVDDNDDGIANLHKFCKENVEILQSRPANRADADKAYNSLKELHQNLLEDHRQRHGDAPVPPEFGVYDNALREFSDPVREKRIEPETRQDAIRWLGGIVDGPPELDTQYRQLLTEQADSLREKSVDLNGGSDAQRQHRAHMSSIDKLESPSAKRQSSVTPIVGHDSLAIEAASSARPPKSTSEAQQAAKTYNNVHAWDSYVEEDPVSAPPLTEQDRLVDQKVSNLHSRANHSFDILRNRELEQSKLDGAYERLPTAYCELHNLNQMPGRVGGRSGNSGTPPVMQAYAEEISLPEALSKERPKSQQAPETTLPSIKQKLPTPARQASVARSKREWGSIDVGHEDISKRQKSDKTEAAALENLLDGTHDDAVQNFGPPIAADEVVPEVPETDVSTSGIGTDFERRPSNKVTIDGSESEDNDGTQSLFGDSDDGQDIAILQQAAAAPPQPVASPNAVEQQPIATTPKSVTSPPATGRPQTPSSNVASPTIGGSPSMRRGLALPQMTPTKQTPPISWPSVTQAQASCSRQASSTTPGPQGMPRSPEQSSRSASRQSSATLPAPADQGFASGAERPYTAPPTTSTEDETDPFPSRRHPTEPDSLNKAIEYTIKGSPEFVRKVEGKVRSPSIIINRDDTETKSETLPDVEGTGPVSIDLMSGMRVGQVENEELRQMAPPPTPALRSLNELLRATDTAEGNDDEEA